MLDRMVRIGDGSEGASGRWRLNAGSPMLLTIPSLRKPDDGPVRVIADLGTLRFAKDKVVALFSHGFDERTMEGIAGFWHRCAASADGIDADLCFLIPRDDREAAVMGDVIRAKAMVEQGVPLQVSIGAVPGPDGAYEPVSPGTIRVNGRTYDIPDDGIPSYVLRNGVIDESSILPFGADDQTGRIAASRNPLRNQTMSLKQLIATHGEKYRHVLAKVYEDAEGQPADKLKAAADEAIRKFELDDRDAKIADRDTKIAALQAENDQLKAAAAKASEEKDDKEDESKKDDKANAGRGSQVGVRFQAAEGAKGDAPKDAVEAMARVRASNGKLTGIALQAEARRQYPTLFKSFAG